MTRWVSSVRAEGPLPSTPPRGRLEAASRRRRLPLIVFLCAFTLYLRTMAPSVAELFDDSLEFQLVGFKLAIAHPTGYPLYTLLLKLFTLLPVGEIAYRANLSSAVLGALAVALVYRIALKLTGAVLPSLAAAAALAISPVFWSQSVIAEVYALNAVLIAAAILVLVGRPLPAPRNSRVQTLLTAQASQDPTPPAPRSSPDLTPLALLAGLMLTHHRTGLLLLPAAALYLWLARPAPALFRGCLMPRARPCGRLEPCRRLAARLDWRALSTRWTQIFTRKTLLAFLLPLVLYVYLPLRGDIGSLDGTYQNTPDGFMRWILASGYNIFLTSNPFNEHYDAAFFAQLFLNQFGWLGLGSALFGLGWLLKRNTAVGLFLLTSFANYLVFVASYHVPDVQVFAIPAFLIVALLLGCGLHALIVALAAITRTWLTRRGGDRTVAPNMVGAHGRASLPTIHPRVQSSVGPFLGFALLLVNLSFIFPGTWAANDLSGRTELRDYGRDMLAQPLPTNATLVGILGEMTLVRYLQSAEGLQPSLITFAADRDGERLAVIDRELAAGHSVFTTRPLNGLPEKYSLAALGPLVRVLPQPQPAALPAEAARVGDIKLRVEGVEQHGRIEGGDTHGSSFLRVNIAWEPVAQISADLKVSARLLDGERLVAQRDDWPVHNVYHTNFWRSGEHIRDTYDITLPPGLSPGTYQLLLILYHAASGAELGRIAAGQAVIR